MYWTQQKDMNKGWFWPFKAAATDGFYHIYMYDIWTDWQYPGVPPVPRGEKYVIGGLKTTFLNRSQNSKTRSYGQKYLFVIIHCEEVRQSGKIATCTPVCKQHMYSRKSVENWPVCSLSWSWTRKTPKNVLNTPADPWDPGFLLLRVLFLPFGSRGLSSIPSQHPCLQGRFWLVYGQIPGFIWANFHCCMGVGQKIIN